MKIEKKIDFEIGDKLYGIKKQKCLTMECNCWLCDGKGRITILKNTNIIIKCPVCAGIGFRREKVKQWIAHPTAGKVVDWKWIKTFYNEEFYICLAHWCGEARVWYPPNDVFKTRAAAQKTATSRNRAERMFLKELKIKEKEEMWSNYKF